MVNPKNKTFCLAEDIVARIATVLIEAEKPEGFEDLSIFVSPEIALDRDDLPFVAIDVPLGDEADQTITQQMDSTGRLMVCNTTISLNLRVNLLDNATGREINNGLKAIAPLHRWCMATLLADRELKMMCQGPIIPNGYGRPYGDTHEMAGKGLIQYLKFRHVLDTTAAWK
jgi:hypothetical protein